MSAKVEVCAFSLESCVVAEQAGASRIELCGGLYEGGTTPSSGLISLVKKQVNIDLFVMIRPRGGDFFYSQSEINVMKADIKVAKDLGANGIVLGILQKNGEVNFAQTKELIDIAYPLKVTFHRAIDVTPDPFEALETIIESGCERILTSGQRNKAIDGIETISKLVEKSKNTIEIMAGSGVNAENAHFFLQKGVNAVHLTGKKIVQSKMEYRKENVSMSDIEGISEFDLVLADFQKINDVVKIVSP